MTTNKKDVTPQQRIALLKHLVNDKTPEAVATILNITRDQVVEVARHHGYPEKQKMEWAIDILVEKATNAETAAIPAGTTVRVAPAKPTPAAPASAPAAVASLTKPDEIRILLNTAKGHPSKRIQTAADRVFDQLDKLRALIREDEEKNAEKRRQAAEREKARAEVKRLEEELRAARAKLRGKDAEPSTTDSDDDSPSARQIRAWANENEVDCPATGRVPAAVREAYDAAHQRAGAA